MAKKNPTSAAPTTPTTTTTTEVSKSQAIRDMAAKFPSAKPKELATKLEAVGLKVSPVYIGSVLKPKAPRIDTATVKKAAAFVKGFDGQIDEVEAMIEQVGKFIDECGGHEKALEAIKTYKDLALLVA